ncbi:hypothetical protein ANN_12318 [Periplaneta americana]|uniref:Uncharacterized protein n=1 Tax=Periplaneta americana TaxID=6978 RepID=A0ABQ8TI64_PERAM|nr:hypothetical protein ANN_12318 [Periplaneta americana]
MFVSVTGMELVGGKWRTISGVSYLFPVPLSYITIAGIAYFIRGWSQLQLAITLPSVLLFGLWCFRFSCLWSQVMSWETSVISIDRSPLS